MVLNFNLLEDQRAFAIADLKIRTNKYTKILIVPLSMMLIGYDLCLWHLLSIFTCFLHLMYIIMLLAAFEGENESHVSVGVPIFCVVIHCQPARYTINSPWNRRQNLWIKWLVAVSRTFFLYFNYCRIKGKDLVPVKCI